MRTKIVATIGPSSASSERIRALIEAGVNVARLNFSHGSHEDHGRVIQWLREASEATGRHIAVLADLCGPKIRIGKGWQVREIAAGQTLVLAHESISAGEEVPTTYEGLARDVSQGDHILLDDGYLELVVLEVSAGRVQCEVVRGGVLKPNKGINLPGIRVSTPALTEKDLADLEFALEQGVDFVGLSFAQRAEDVRDLRSRIPEHVQIVTKIEKDVALDNLEAIMAETDAVMVARGDLGVELPFAKVPVIQKRIIEMARAYGRPVITATQMLESMIENARPTRAEASDVANAVFQKTDAVMLSAETAAGKYPVEAVEAMAAIIRETEGAAEFSLFQAPDLSSARHLRADRIPTEHAIAAATVAAVHDLHCPAVVTLTHSGFTARMVASYRPSVPIVAVSDQARTCRQLSLVWGVEPILAPETGDNHDMLCEAQKYLANTQITAPGDRIVVTSGYPSRVSGTTNTLRVLGV